MANHELAKTLAELMLQYWAKHRDDKNTETDIAYTAVEHLSAFKAYALATIPKVADPFASTDLPSLTEYISALKLSEPQDEDTKTVTFTLPINTASKTKDTDHVINFKLCRKNNFSVAKASDFRKMAESALAAANKAMASKTIQPAQLAEFNKFLNTIFTEDLIKDNQHNKKEHAKKIEKAVAQAAKELKKLMKDLAEQVAKENNISLKKALKRIQEEEVKAKDTTKRPIEVGIFFSETDGDTEPTNTVGRISIHSPLDRDTTTSSNTRNRLGVANWLRSGNYFYKKDTSTNTYTEKGKLELIRSSSINPNGILKRSAENPFGESYLRSSLHSFGTRDNLLNEIMPRVSNDVKNNLSLPLDGNSTENPLVIPYIMHTLVTPTPTIITKSADPDVYILTANNNAFNAAASSTSTVTNADGTKTYIQLDPIYFNSGVNLLRGVFRSKLEDNINIRSYNKLINLTIDTLLKNEALENSVRTLINSLNENPKVEEIKAAIKTLETQLGDQYKQLHSYSLTSTRCKDDDEFGTLIQNAINAQAKKDKKEKLSTHEKTALMTFNRLIKDPKYKELKATIAEIEDDIFLLNRTLYKQHMQPFVLQLKAIDTSELSIENKAVITDTIKFDDAFTHRYPSKIDTLHLFALKAELFLRPNKYSKSIIAKIEYLEEKRNKGNYGLSSTLPQLQQSLKNLRAFILYHVTCKSGNDRTSVSDIMSCMTETNKLQGNNSATANMTAEERDRLLADELGGNSSQKTCENNRNPGQIQVTHKGVFNTNLNLHIQKKLAGLFKDKYKHGHIAKPVKYLLGTALIVLSPAIASVAACALSLASIITLGKKSLINNYAKTALLATVVIAATIPVTGLVVAGALLAITGFKLKDFLWPDKAMNECISNKRKKRESTEVTQIEAKINTINNMSKQKISHKIQRNYLEIKKLAITFEFGSLFCRSRTRKGSVTGTTPPTNTFDSV